MSPRSEMLLKLEQIEQELRSIGFWQESGMDPFAHLAPEEPRSYLSASSFEEWLQHLFLPNARRAVESGELPADSQVGVMALRQYDYHSYVPEARELVRLLSEFDELVRAHGGGKQP